MFLREIPSMLLMVLVLWVGYLVYFVRFCALFAAFLQLRLRSAFLGYPLHSGLWFQHEMQEPVDCGVHSRPGTKCAAGAKAR